MNRFVVLVDVMEIQVSNKYDFFFLYLGYGLYLTLLVSYLEFYLMNVRNLGHRY